MEILIFILTCCGITFTIVDSYIAKPIVNRLKGINKFFNKLLSCYACTGFWVGLLLSLFIFNPISNIAIFKNYVFLDNIVLGFISLSCCFLYKSLINFLNPNA